MSKCAMKDYIQVTISNVKMKIELINVTVILNNFSIFYLN